MPVNGRAGRERRPYGLKARSVLSLLSMLACLTGCAPDVPETPATDDPAPDPERGKALVSVYGCSACHLIPGVAGNPGSVGPPLTEWGRRKYIAGRVPNEPRTLVLWLRNPQEVKPGTAMPDLGVSEDEAMDMAAFLYRQ